MEYNIVVKVEDSVNGIYEKISKIDEQTLESFNQLFQEIKVKGDYNWYTCGHDESKPTPKELYNNIVVEDVIEKLEGDYFPYCEYGYITIHSIEIFPYVEMIEKII